MACSSSIKLRGESSLASACAEGGERTTIESRPLNQRFLEAVAPGLDRFGRSAGVARVLGLVLCPQVVPARRSSRGHPLPQRRQCARQDRHRRLAHELSPGPWLGTSPVRIPSEGRRRPDDRPSRRPPTGLCGMGRPGGPAASFLPRLARIAGRGAPWRRGGQGDGRPVDRPRPARHGSVGLSAAPHPRRLARRRGGAGRGPRAGPFRCLGNLRWRPYAAACAWKLSERLTGAGIVSSLAPLDVPGAVAGMGRRNRLTFQLVGRVGRFAAGSLRRDGGVGAPPTRIASWSAALGPRWTSNTWTGRTCERSSGRACPRRSAAGAAGPPGRWASTFGRGGFGSRTSGRRCTCRTGSRTPTLRSPWAAIWPRAFPSAGPASTPERATFTSSTACRRSSRRVCA